MGRKVTRPFGMPVTLDVHVFPRMEQQRSPQVEKRQEEVTDRHRMAHEAPTKLKQSSTLGNVYKNEVSYRTSTPSKTKIMSQI